MHMMDTHHAGDHAEFLRLMGSSLVARWIRIYTLYPLHDSRLHRALRYVSRA